MALSNDLIQEFASVMGNAKEKHVDTTCYGKVTRMESSTNGFIQLDGADSETPASFTVAAHANDRVLAILKNRSALVIGNITHPVIMTGTLYASDAIVVEGYLTTNASRTRYNDTINGLTFDANGIGAYSNLSSWWLKNDGTFQFGGENGITFSDNKVRFGSDVVVGWGNIPDKPSIPTDINDLTDNHNKLWTTTIADTWIETSTVYAQNLEVSMAKVQGDLQVSRISGTASGSAYSGADPWSINFKTGTITIGSISASSIKAGYISVDRIEGNSIPNSKLSGTASGTAFTGATAWSINFNTGAITIGEISANKIRTGTLTVGGSNNVSGTISVKNASGTEVVKCDNAGIWAIAGKIGGANGWDIGTGYLRASYTSSGTKYVGMGISGVTYAFFANASNSSGSDGVFRVGHDGKLVATDATITGSVTASSGSIGGLTLNGNTMYTEGHPAWNTAANGVFISGTGDYPLSIGSGGAFYVTKQGVPHCNGASLYINSAPAVGNDSSGIGLQISNSLVGEICMAKESATVSNMELTSYNGGVSINGNTWIALFAPSVTTYGHVKITEGSNIYLKAASTDPGDLVFLDSSETEMGRIWNSNNTLNFRAGPSGTDFIVGQSTNYSYNSLLVGASKSNYYTQPGVSIMTNGNITLTYDGGGAGIYFAYNKAAAYTVGLHESSSGTLSCTGGFNTAASIVCGSSTRTVGTFVKVWNSSHQGSLFADTTGKLGIYSDTKSCWAMYIDTNGDVFGRILQSTRSDKMHRLVGSTDKDGCRVVLLKYGDQSGSTKKIQFYAQTGTSGSSYDWRTPEDSDIRLKKNIKESAVDSLSVLNKVKLYSFDWKDGSSHWDIGFIANYIVDADPNLANITTKEHEYSSINTFYMQGHIVKAIQQLTARIEELEKKLKGAA